MGIGGRKPPTRSSIAAKSFVPEQQSCGLEQHVCGPEQHVCGLEQHVRGLEQQFCGLEQQSSRPDRQFSWLAKPIPSSQNRFQCLLNAPRSGSVGWNSSLVARTACLWAGT